MKVFFDVNNVTSGQLLKRLDELYHDLNIVSKDDSFYFNNWIKDDIWDIEQELKKRGVTVSV